MDRRSDQTQYRARPSRSQVLKGLIILVLISALLQSFTIVDAWSVANSGDILSRGSETFAADTNTIVTSKGIHKVGSDSPAAGDIASGVEATTSMPQMNNILASGHYTYVLEVKEAAVDSWSVGDRLTVEVYGRTNSSTDKLATLYIRQGTANDDAIEGVTATVDVGSAGWIPDLIDVVVTHR